MFLENNSNKCPNKIFQSINRQKVYSGRDKIRGMGWNSVWYWNLLHFNIFFNMKFLRKIELLIDVLLNIITAKEILEI